MYLRFGRQGMYVYGFLVDAYGFLEIFKYFLKYIKVFLAEWNSSDILYSKYEHYDNKLYLLQWFFIMYP